MRRYLRDPMFSRFDTIPECDGHTHTHTDTRRRHIPRLARRRAVKICLSVVLCQYLFPTPFPVIINRVAGEIIRLVASVCVCVRPFVCAWALSCLNRLTFDRDFGMRVDLDPG